MNVEHMQVKKGLTILDHGAAKVPDWELAFPKGGYAYVEPAFACAYPKQGAEIHGLAFAVSRADKDRLDAREPYKIAKVTLQFYDGR